MDKVNYPRWKRKSDNDKVLWKGDQPSINEGSRRLTKGTDHQRSTFIDKVRRSQVNATIYLLIVGNNIPVAKQQCQQTWPTIYQAIYDIRQLSAIKKLYTPKSKTAKQSPNENKKGKGCRTYLLS